MRRVLTVPVVGAVLLIPWGMLCLAPVPGEGWSFWMPALGKPNYLAMFLVWWIGVPLVLWVGGRDLRAAVKGRRAGVLCGLILASWFNCLVIGFPYLGGYPSLPSICIARLLAKDPWHSLDFWVWLYGLNLVLWGGIGMGSASPPGLHRDPGP